MKKQSKIMNYCFCNDKLVFKIGYKNLWNARQPLKLHHHDNLMEFTYIVAGSHTYQINDMSYTVNKGEVFFTYPYETHSTGGHPEEVSEFYYLFIDPELFEDFNLFIFPEEYEKVRNFWRSIEERIYKPSPGLHTALKKLMSHFKSVNGQYTSEMRNSLSDVIIALATSQNSLSDNPLDEISKSLEYIHSHLNEALHISELCGMDHLSVSAYNNAFVRAMGMPPGKYILKCKIDKAKEMLVTTDLSVTDIAYRLGFSSSQYFATAFKRICYKTPAEYRKTKHERK